MLDATAAAELLLLSRLGILLVFIAIRALVSCGNEKPCDAGNETSA
jgi:hypothetical protein